MKKLALGILFISTMIFGAVAQSAMTPLAVIKLNGTETITLKELKDRVEVYQKQMPRQMTAEERAQILESLIDQKLVVQAAKKEGVVVTNSQVDQYFLMSMSQQIGRNVSEKELADIVKQNTGKTLDEFIKGETGMNVTEYKEYLKSQLISQQYVLSKKQAELQMISATDKEIRDFYDKNKSSFVQNDMLRMFLVSVQKGSDVAAAKAKIEGLLKDFKANKLTADAMRVQSRNADSPYQAGDLYISKTEQHAAQLGITYERLQNIFEENLNTPSDIKEAERDFQFYVILEKFPAKMLGISDVVQPGTNTTIYEYIKANLTQQKQAQGMIKAVQDITKELAVDANLERKKTGDDLLKLLSW